MHVYATPRCNLECPHCYYDALGRGGTPKDALPLHELGRVITDICQRFDADISLEGGEPFLRKGLGDMLAALPPDVLRRITLTTNGTVPVVAPAAVLRTLGALRISVDGHDERTHRALRGVGLTKILNTCRALTDLQVPFVTRMTLWRENTEHLREIYAFVAEQGVKRLSLFEYQASGRGSARDSALGVTDARMSRFFQDLLHIARPATLEVLTINLAKRRVEAAQSLAEDLAAAGITLNLLPRVANCTVNYNGEIGVSPWQVTAHGASDAFAHVSSGNFLELVEDAALAGSLYDTGEFISHVQLRAEKS